MESDRDIGIPNQWKFENNKQTLRPVVLVTGGDNYASN